MLNTQENTINQHKELLEIWNPYNQRPNTSSFGKHLSNILEITFNLENPSTLRNSVLSLTMCRLSFQKFMLQEMLVLRLIFSLKDKREKIFIILSQFLLLTHSFNITSLDIQERKKFPHQSVSTLFIKKVSEPSTPTQFQLLPQLASELTLSTMLWIHFS